MPETKNRYTAADIQVLEGLEAVRRRPGMYIGSTDERGLHHLVYEIVDNSIDEAMAGFCDRIRIMIMPDGSVRVSDNGRGIPIDKHPRTGKSALETVMTYLHAGGKFASQAYKASGGLHDVGAAVVNALSSHMWVEVTRDGKLYRQEYERGKAAGELKASSNGATHTGTTTWFIPDADIFGETEFNFSTLTERFREMAFLTKGIWIHFVDERSQQRITYYFEGGIKSFVRRLNKDRGTVHEPFYMERDVEGSIVEVAIQYNDSFNESTFAFANCIHTIDGGTHLTGFRSALTRVLNDYARRQKILKDNDPNLSGEDTREGLVAVVSVKLPEPQFEGQTKTSLGIADMMVIVDAAHGVIIMTDADVDGAHIRTLLLTFFYRYMRDLIERGHLYIAQPPLYRVQYRRDVRWFYSDKERDAYLSKLKDGKGVTIQRYKGLGEMNPNQLWETTMDPDIRTVLSVNVEDAMRADTIFTQLMGEEVAPRKTFIQSHYNQVRNLDV